MMGTYLPGMNNRMEKEVVISKLIAAPREALWRAWTDPAHIAQWWGPNGTTIPESTFEPGVGGKLRIVMLAGPELGPMAGQRWPMEGEVQEFVAPERLTFTNNALDTDGNVLLSGFTTVELKEEAASTLMTVVAKAAGDGPRVGAMLGGMEQGWNEQLNKLVTFVTAPMA